MVLVSLVLVVVAAVTLVIGLLQSGLTIIYISIGCSVAAGLVLAAAVLRGRPEPRMAGTIGPQPGPTPAPQPSASWQAPQPATVGAAATGASAGAGPQPAEAEPVAGFAPDSTQQLQQVVVDEEEEVDLPIDDYDSLRAADIIPLLADLDAAELQRVRGHEDARKHRFTVLRRIDSELANREPAGWDVSEEEWEGEDEEDEEGDEVAVAVEEELVEVAVDEDALEDVEEELEVEIEALDEEEDYEEDPDPAPPLAPVRAGRARAGGFPIADYDQLMMLEVLPRLVELDSDELLAVRDREQSGLSRSTILNRIDRLLEQQMVRPTSTARRRASARKTAAKKAPARKTAAKKAPARKTAAKKAPARKTATKKAPAKKSPAKKASASAKKTTRRR